MALKLDKLASRQRPGGSTPGQVSKEIQDHPDLQHYQWSELMYMPLDFFRDNPANRIFAEIKNTEENRLRYQTLKDDIRAVGIHEPILATQKGLILSGHSRIQIARELLKEGSPLGKIPVILLESKISDDEMDRIIVSCNVNRFQTDMNTRLIQMAKIAPNYFKQKVTGKATATVSGEKSFVQETFSISPAQVKREKQVYLTACDIAVRKGKEYLSPEDIEEARQVLAEKSKKSQEKQKHIKPTQDEVVNRIWDLIRQTYKSHPNKDEILIGIMKFLVLANEQGLLKGIDINQLKA